MLGSDIEDKKGTEYAQQHYYDKADKIMENIPEDYKRFRDLDNEIW